jgi:hypothetical protein
MSFEYKCVGGPERPMRQRGTSRSERVALAMQEIIGAEAVDGWEYLRTDLVPVEEKAGLFSRRHDVHRAVLVFRRERTAARPERQTLARGLAADPEPPASLGAAPRESNEEREARIRLSAERGAPANPRRGRPSGLD